jgi:lysocardiolipin and lysophospholipid acyltransferase
MSTTMTTDHLRQRHGLATAEVPDDKLTTEKSKPESTQHPGGEIKHGAWQQALRMFLFAVYFNGSILA